VGRTVRAVSTLASAFSRSMASCACCSSALCVATRVARTPSDERRHDAKDRESGHLNTDALARDLVGGEL
jgi:hypothetical protein